MPSDRSGESPLLTRYLRNLGSDLPAAVVVFLVAVPLCLGIALASGAPLIAGVISGVVGGVVVGSLSGSRLGVSGPAAGLAVIVLNAITELGSFEQFLLAVVLAGVLQLALGFLRAGLIAYYFPSAVVTGMLTAIGIIITLKQIPHAVGWDADPEGDFSFNQIDGETTLSELLNLSNHFDAGPLFIASVSLAILIAWETRWVKQSKWLRPLPGPLLAILAGVALGFAFDGSPGWALRTEQLVQIPVTSSFSDFLTHPEWSGLGRWPVYKTAFVMAVVASLETLLSVEATDKLDTLKHVTPTNRELKAQGVGNIVAGLLGGLPVTQVIVRSSANIQAGGKTKVSAIAHGLLLLVCVAALPSLLNRIPLAALAAVLLLVGYKLAKPSIFRRMLDEGPTQAVPFLATVLGVVFTDLLTGIGVGLVVAIVGLLRENMRLANGLSAVSEGTGDRLRITLAQHVTFLNKASILQSLNEVPDNVDVQIDATESHYVHADVVEIIDNFVQGAPERGITVKVLGLEHHQKGSPEPTLTITRERLSASPASK